MNWRRSVGCCVLLLGGIFIPSRALQCLEGSDCVWDASCTECSGVACTRVTSFNVNDNKEVALTCLPYDTRTFSPPHLEVEGCRQMEDHLVCICYNHDYCNSVLRSSPGVFWAIAVLVHRIFFQ